MQHLLFPPNIFMESAAGSMGGSRHQDKWRRQAFWPPQDGHGTHACITVLGKPSKGVLNSRLPWSIQQKCFKKKEGPYLTLPGILILCSFINSTYFCALNKGGKMEPSLQENIGIASTNLNCYHVKYRPSQAHIECVPPCGIKFSQYEC